MYHDVVSKNVAKADGAALCRHVNCLQANAQVLRWWQTRGHKQSPNVRVYKDASSIPDKLLDDTKPRRKRGRDSAA